MLENEEYRARVLVKFQIENAGMDWKVRTAKKRMIIISSRCRFFVRVRPLTAALPLPIMRSLHPHPFGLELERVAALPHRAVSLQFCGIAISRQV